LTEEFRKRIPVNGLILVGAVVSSFLNYLYFITDQSIDEGRSSWVPRYWLRQSSWPISW
jgi:hypothetical protein